jgi:hypothetical protein
MTSISKTLKPVHSRARQHAAHPLRRDVSIGLGIILIVLTMAALQTRGRSELQTDGAWPGVAESKSQGGWEDSVPPDLFPLGRLTGDVSR